MRSTSIGFWFLLFLSSSVACSGQPPRPTTNSFGLSVPTTLGEGSGDSKSAATATPVSRSSPVPAPAPPRGSQPDPEPLRQSEQWEYEIEWNAGELQVIRALPRKFQSPVVTARKIGRFAIELWVGAELLERVRFDFPLLGVDESDWARSSGARPPSLEKGVRVRQRVLVPAAERARRAVLIDGSTSKTLDLEWPPSTQKTSPLAPATSTPAQALPAKAPLPGRPEFIREFAQPVTALALDAPPHVAALGATAVFVRDRTGWHEQALPASVLQAPELRLSLFYGRDFRVRVVGTHAGPKGTQSVYLRSLPGGFKAAPDELGRLGNTRTGALVAVLGTADPEVVCRPGDLCLIKRISGWSSLPAPSDLSRVAISNGVGWAAAGKQLLREGRTWTPVGTPGPWQRAGTLFLVGERAFVLEPERRLIHEFANGLWRSSESPVGAPSAIWGAAPDALWLVGEGGVARFDGNVWRKVDTAPSELTTVLGSKTGEVWFSGKSGVYRVSEVRP